MEKTLQSIKKALKTNQNINEQKLLEKDQDENQLTKNNEQKQQNEDELKKQLQNGQELQQMKEQDDSSQQNKEKKQIEQVQEKNKSQQNHKKEKTEEEQDTVIYYEKQVQIINPQSKFAELYDENEAAIKFYSFVSIAYYGLVKSYNFCIQNYDLEFWQKILSYYHRKIVDEQNIQCMKVNIFKLKYFEDIQGFINEEQISFDNTYQKITKEFNQLLTPDQKIKKPQYISRLRKIYQDICNALKAQQLPLLSNQQMVLWIQIIKQKKLNNFFRPEIYGQLFDMLLQQFKNNYMTKIMEKNKSTDYFIENQNKVIMQLEGKQQNYGNFQRNYIIENFDFEYVDLQYFNKSKICKPLPFCLCQNQQVPLFRLDSYLNF